MGSRDTGSRGRDTRRRGTMKSKALVGAGGTAKGEAGSTQCRCNLGGSSTSSSGSRPHSSKSIRCSSRGIPSSTSRRSSRVPVGRQERGQWEQQVQGGQGEERRWVAEACQEPLRPEAGPPSTSPRRRSSSRPIGARQVEGRRVLVCLAVEEVQEVGEGTEGWGEVEEEKVPRVGEGCG
ncbi:unnamed protein product, partial [Closterium sp. NIES-53]